jgi:acyl carrier protein
MEILEFIKLMAEQFDETAPEEFTELTEFKELKDYNSLTALNIISVIDDEFDVYLKGDDIRNSKTISDLFERVKLKIE